MNKKYIITKHVYYTDKEYVFYGMAFICDNGSSIEILKEYDTLTHDKNKIMNILNVCNLLDIINQDEFDYIIEDMLSMD